jgi:hypothetical protein
VVFPDAADTSCLLLTAAAYIIAATACLLAVNAAGCCLPHALLQVVQLFDDILLLTDGHVVYQ